MNTLEKMAIDKAKFEIRAIQERVSDENKGRMEHEMIFIRGNADRAWAALRALEENDSEKGGRS